MGVAQSTLDEKRRSQLDGIVQKMIENSEPEENIRLVVDDFKAKYSEKKKEVSIPSWVSSSKPSRVTAPPVAQSVSAGLGSATKKTGGAVEAIAKSQPLPEKTPEQKLIDLGINVTFQPEKTFIGPEQPRDIDLSKPHQVLGIDKPLYIDKSNPDALSFLSESIEAAKEEATKNSFKFGALVSDKLKAEAYKKDKEYSKKIKAADDLMGEISAAAANNVANIVIQNKTLENFTRTDLLNAGKLYVKQVAPSQHKRNESITLGGEDLGDENKYNLESIGGQILLNSVPDEQKPQVKSLIDETEIAHPQYSMAKGWEIIGAYNHLKDNRASGGWWRTRPTVGMLKKWIDDPQLKEMFAGNEVSYDLIKKQIQSLPDDVNSYRATDVPVGGFLNKASQAISGGAESIGNIGKSDAERQKSNLNPTLRRGSLTGNYGLPGKSGVLVQRRDELEEKKKDEGLTPQEEKEYAALERSTKVMDGWDKFAAGSGDVTGQVILQGLLTKGFGLGAKGLSGIMSIGKIPVSVNAGVSIGLTSYDGIRKQAVYNFPGDDLKQNIYTGTMLAANILSERIFQDEKAINAITKTLRTDVKDLIKNLSPSQIAKADVRTLLKDKIVKFGKEWFKESNKEALEEVVVQAVDEVSQYTLGAEDYQSENAIRNIGDTYLTMMLHGSPVAALAARSNVLENAFNKVGVYKMATNPAVYQSKVNELYTAGEITKQEKDDAIHILETANTLVANEPARISSKKTKERADYLIQNLNAALQEEKLEHTVDPNEQKEIKDQIKASEERSAQIFEAPTPEQEVINKALKANEIQGMYKGIAEEAAKDPDAAIQFLEDAASQLNNEVGGEIGDSRAASEKTFGKTISKYLRPEPAAPTPQAAEVSEKGLYQGTSLRNAENIVRNKGYKKGEEYDDIRFGGKSSDPVDAIWLSRDKTLASNYADENVNKTPSRLIHFDESNIKIADNDTYKEYIKKFGYDKAENELRNDGYDGADINLDEISETKIWNYEKLKPIKTEVVKRTGFNEDRQQPSYEYFPESNQPTNEASTQEATPTESELRKGEEVVSQIDAETRLSNGERIFAQHEQGGEPFEIRDVGELEAYAPDQLIAIPRKENPFVKPKATVPVKAKGKLAAFKDKRKPTEAAPVREEKPKAEKEEEFELPKVGAKYKFQDGSKAEIVGEKGFAGTQKIWEVKTPKGIEQLTTQDLRKGVFGKTSLQEKPAPAKEEIIAKPPTKEGNRKIRDEKVKKQIDAAWDDFLKGSDTLTSGGLDPKKIEAGTKLIGLYIKSGVYKFGDILEDAYGKFGDKLHEFVEALKAVYSAYYSTQATDEEAAQMDESVRNVKLQDVINRIENGLPPKIEKEEMPANPVRYFVDSVKEKLRAKQKLNIVSLRKIASENGIEAVDTEIQEMTELAIVELAREIGTSNKSWENRYKGIVELYENQPTISMRSSERIDKQQYSTPIPMGFLMGGWVNQNNPKVILEPNAGNGMLTVGIPAKKVIANEIDPVRLKMLADQGFRMVTDQDATRSFPFKVDGVVMNPPFGSKAAEDFDGVQISGLDEQMVASALRSLNTDGRAAIIIGGHNTYDEKGRLKADRTFLNFLYSRYKVVDIINIDGSLYSKQGTSFPTRIILIDGVKEQPSGNAPLEDKKMSAPVTDFSELYNRIQNVKQYENTDKPSGVQAGVDAKPINGNAVHGRVDQPGKKQGAGVGVNTNQDKLLSSTSDKVKGETPPANRGFVDDLSRAINTGERQPDTGNNADRALGESTEQVSSEQQGTTGNIEGRGDAAVRASDAVPIPDRTVSILNEKSKYEPKSKGKSVDTVMPSQMATETYHTLDAISEIYGDIDDFVRTELGYKTNDQLFKALSAEQVDAVAIAIHQLKTGQGMIIGDMTGVGKGRIAAAIIRYAVNNGSKPIFLTEKPNLFSDLYRDLVAIGSEKLNPFIVNSKSAANNPDITNADGVVVHKSFTGARKNAILSAAEIPKEFDFTVATYSQFRTALDKPSVKRDFFLRTAQGNFLIMDESHNASGESNAGELFQDLLPNTKGVVFLSATFAKRPDNMPVYAMKTAMADANLSSDELVEAIRKGGVALQEVVAAQLVQSGQMIRRERTFEGVKVEYSVLEQYKDNHRKVADEFTEVVRDVIDFEKRYVLPILDGIDSEMAAQQGKAEKRKGTKEAGVSNVPFASKTFNLINQMLFTIKAKEIAKAAIEAHKQGKKPVIGFLSTMESFLNSMGVSVGERLEKADFALVMKRALEGTMKYTIDDGMGNRKPAQLSRNELTREGAKRYDELVQKIRGITSGISISPIDVMIKELTDAGLRVGEITGRSKYLEIQPDGSSVVKERKDKDINKTARAFNSGESDVILLNASGATGLSLHASRDFKDQKPRVLISGQLELDINKEVQKRGRVDRTGQVHRAEYQYIVSSIPAEQRLLMMFKAKLKSLDANTTSSQKSKANDLELTDFLNKYGDEVVTQYAKDNTEFNERIMDPLHLLDKSEDELADIKKIENAASKVTGRVAILPTKEQEIFYSEIIEAYQSYLNYLKDNNENDLEVKLLPLNAETKSTTEVIAGRGTESPFGMPSVRETVEVDVLTKPMKKKEIDYEIEKSLDGKTAKEQRDNLLKELGEYEETFIDTKIKKIEKDYAEHIIPETIERAIAKEKTEDEIKAIREGLENAREKKIDRERIKYQNSFSYVESVLRTFVVGDIFNIPVSTRVDTNTFFSKAVLVGVQVKEGSVNKYTPSNIVLKFAVNDSRRTVTVPLSKVDYINSIIAQSRFIENKPQILEEWDSRISNKTRATRHIITGNLLQAYGTNDGQLVAYTTKGGAIKKGMLLPDSYDPNKQKLRTTISRAFKDGTAKIVSTDGEVSVERFRNGYSLSVPLSKQRGGKYFLNDRIRSLAEGGGFNQRGNQMQAYINQENIRDVLLALDSLGVTVESEISEGGKPQIQEKPTDDVKEMKSIVRDFVDAGETDLNAIKDAVAEELEDDSSQLRDLVEDAYFEYSKEKTAAPEKVTKEVIERVNDFVEELYGGSATVLASEKELRDKAAELGSGVAFMKSGEGKLLGFAHQENIYLNAEQLNPNTPVHEAGHVWSFWARQNAPELYEKGLELTEDSRYLKKVKDSPAYQKQAANLPANQRESYYQNEALAMAIGDKGAQFVLEAKKKGFREWLNNLWNTIKKALGFKDITPEELQNLTLDEFASRAAADILRGKEETETDLGDVSGIKKSLVPRDVVDATEFERMGDNELMKKGRQIIASGKVKPEAIINKIIDEGKGVLTPEEVVALITYKRELDNDLQAAYSSYNEKMAAGDDIGTTGVDIAAMEDKIHDYQMMAVITANQQSMAFRLRRKLLDSGFNIVTQIEQYKKNNNGYIPPDVLQKFEDYGKQVAALEKQLVEEREAFEKAEAERAMADIQEAIAREAEIEQRIAEGVEEQVSVLYRSLSQDKRNYADRAIAALDRIQKNLRGKAYGGIAIPVAIIDAGITSIKAAIRAGKTVADAVEIGIERIKKLLKGKPFDSEEDFRKDMLEGFDAAGIKETKINTKAVLHSDGTVTIPHRIIRDLVKSGIDTIEDLTDAVMEIIIDDIPDVTHRQVRDFITGYGKIINPTQDEISLKIAELKRVGRLLSEYEDLQKGKLKTKNPVKLARITQREIELKAKIKILSEIEIEKQAIQPTPEEIRAKRQKREDYLSQQIADLKEKLRVHNFSKKKTKPKVTNAKILDLEAQLSTIKDEAEREQEKIRLKNRTWHEKLVDYLVELVSGIPRAIVASLDFSATMVQGVIKWFTQPLYSARALKESFLQFFSAKRERNYITRLHSQPYYPLLKASGLPIGETNVKLSVKEGVFFLNFVNHLYDAIVYALTLGYKPATNFVKGLNPFKASQRAYEGYLNHLRVQVFLHEAKRLERKGYRFETDPEIFKQTAKNVGTTTGRGDLGRKAEGAKFLDIIFFSVRKVVSEIKLFTPLAFIHYAKMPAVVRHRALLDFARFVTSYVTLNAAVWALRKDWDDEEEDHFWDPTSSDFLTHNINGTRIGIGSGMKAILVFQARFASGLFTGQDGKTEKLGERGPMAVINSRGELVWSFVKNKFSPGVGLIANKLEEKPGRPVSDREIIESTVLPMWMQDVSKLYKTHPTEIAGMLNALSLLGFSVRAEDEKVERRPDTPAQKIEKKKAARERKRQKALSK